MNDGMPRHQTQEVEVLGRFHFEGIPVSSIHTIEMLTACCLTFREPKPLIADANVYHHTAKYGPVAHHSRNTEVV